MISVCVPHQLDSSKPYLELCLKALQATKDIDFEVFVLDGSETYASIPEDKRFARWSNQPKGVAGKLEAFMKVINPKSTHFVLISDDVMVSQYALADMYSAFQGRDMIMNPMSNSDCTALYEADLYLSRTIGHNSTEIKKIHPDMEYEDLEGWHESVIKYSRRDKCLVPFGLISFYCTMIPISVWKKVGGLDEKMEYRHNDQDYCIRAMQLGIPSVVNMGAFAFHFGSKTMRKMATPEMQNECTDYFRKKWSK